MLKWTKRSELRAKDMDELRGIVRQELCEYGCVRVRLREVMEKRGVTRNRLRALTGIKYDVITRYYKGENIAKVDLDLLARICYTLNCTVADLLVYQPAD